MQPPAGFAVEFFDFAGYRRGCSRTQRLFQRPERFFFVFCLDQDQPRGIESERGKPMAMRPDAGEASRGKYE